MTPVMSSRVLRLDAVEAVKRTITKYSHAVQTKLAEERPVRSHFEWAGINGGTLFTFFLPQIECRTVDAHGIVANKY